MNFASSSEIRPGRRRKSPEADLPRNVQQTVVVTYAGAERLTRTERILFSR